MKNEFMVIAHLSNQVSALNRIISIYLQKGLEIESLSLNGSNIKGVNILTIKTHETQEGMERVVNLIEKMVDVHYAKYYKC